jgi:uncharacterized membrane protein (UPF0136 family)
MDGTLACAVSHVRDATGRQISLSTMSTHAILTNTERAAQLKKRTRTTGIVLACVALTIMLTVWWARMGYPI